MNNMPIAFKKYIIIILFYLTMLVIGFGSVGSGIYNNNMISSFFAIFFAIFLFFFNEYVWNNINFSLLKPVLLMFFSFYISCFFAVLPDNQQNWMRFYAIFSSVILGYFSYILMVKNIISFVGVSRVLAGIGLAHVFNLLYMWHFMPNPIDYNWVTGLYFFSNIRHLATLLSICFLCSFFLMVSSAMFYQKIFGFLIGIMILSAIFWTGSRTAYLGILVALLVFIVFSKKRFINMVIVLGMIAISMLLSLLFTVNNTSLGLFSSFGRSANVSSIEQLSSGRVGIYKNILEWISYSPIWGYGGDAVSQLKLIFTNGLYLTQAHNAILQVLVEFGVMGLLSVLLVVYKVMLDFKQDKLTNRQLYSIAVIFNIIVASLLDGGAYYVVSISLMCIFIAIIYAERALSIKNT